MVRHAIVTSLLAYGAVFSACGYTTLTTQMVLVVKPPLKAVPRQEAGSPPLGIRVVELEPSVARELNIAGGVLVVHSTGAAYVSGLRGEDVITKINGRNVANVEEFWDKLNAANWRATLQVIRGAQLLTVQLVQEPVER